MKSKFVEEAFAYPDSKCVFGYMVVHHGCKDRAPRHVDVGKPIEQPPAVGKVQPCEVCGKRAMLAGYRNEGEGEKG